MSKLASYVDVTRTFAGNAAGLVRSGRVMTYLRRLRSSQTMLQLNLFLGLPEIRGTRRLSRLAWGVVRYRLLNDLDFFGRRWQRFEVEGWRHVEQALERGKGAIVCSQHLGPYRRIFFELLERGLSVNLVVDAKVSSTFKQKVEAQLRRQGWSPSRIEELLSRLRVLNAESVGSVRDMIQAVRRNEVVLVYLDGNTGVGAPGAESVVNTVEVSFFGQRMRVRRGVCQIAHATGAALIPLFTRWERSLRSVMTIHEPIVPEPGVNMAAFAQDGMSRLYALSETAIRERPAQFEEWVHAHRWRADSPAEQASAEFRQEAAEIVLDGKRIYRVDERRVMVLTVGGLRVLVDGERGSLMTCEGLTRPVLRRLYSGASLDSLVAKFGRRQPHGRLVEVLARLKELDLLEEVPQPV